MTSTEENSSLIDKEGTSGEYSDRWDKPIRDDIAPMKGIKEHPSRMCILTSFGTFLVILTTMFFTVGLMMRRPLLGPLFLAAIIPSLFILYLAYKKEEQRDDKYARGVCATLPETHSDKVPLEILVIGLSMGILSTIPVGLFGGFTQLAMESFAKSFKNGLSMPVMFFYSFTEAYIMTAIVEEGAKYLCAQYAVQKDEFRPYIDHPYGVVLFGLAAALGFAGLENVTYVLGESSEGSGWALAVVRALMAVPLHGTTGALIGVGLARKHYFNDVSFRAPKILSWPVFIHGTYDFIWMAPLRSGKFEGDNKGIKTADNTLDLGGFLAVVYIANMCFVFWAARFAVLQGKKVREDWAQEIGAGDKVPDDV